MLNTILIAAAKLLRGLVFVLLLALQPIAQRLLMLVSGCSMLLFIGTLILRPAEVTPMLAFLTASLVAAGLYFLFQWALMALAPPGFVTTLGE